MILVTVGASQIPFDRLLRAMDDFAIGEQVIVQHGASSVRPAGASCVPFIPLARLSELVREAQAVVTHAGVGTILLALTNGKRPYVVPRRQMFGEAVDDHQLECGRRFARAGVVTLVEDPTGLAAAIQTRAHDEQVFTRPSEPVQLVHELRTYFDAVVPTDARPARQ